MIYDDVNSKRANTSSGFFTPLISFLILEPCNILVSFAKICNLRDVLKLLGVKSVKIISIDLLLLNKIGFSNLKKIKQFFLSFVKKLFIKRIPLSKGIKLFLSLFF